MAVSDTLSDKSIKLALKATVDAGKDCKIAINFPAQYGKIIGQPGLDTANIRSVTGLSGSPVYGRGGRQAQVLGAGLVSAGAALVDGLRRFARSWTVGFRSSTPRPGGYIVDIVAQRLDFTLAKTHALLYGQRKSAKSLIYLAL